MSDEDSADEVEAPPEEDSEAEALEFFGNYAEKRRALPWNEKTRTERIQWYADRIFFGFVVIFIIVMFFDISYKIWWVSNEKKIMAFMSDFVAWLNIRKVASNCVTWITAFVSEAGSRLNVQKITVHVSDFVSWLSQEKQEKKIEL